MSDETAIANMPEDNGWKRRVALFLGSQSLSMFGSSLVQYAIMWHVTLTTQSGSVITAYILAAFLPQIAVSIFGGVWADRYPRKKMIMITDTAIAFCTLILALVFMSGYYSLWFLFFVSSLRAVGSGLMTPAVNAVIPQLVPEKHLMRVNGIYGSLQALVFFVSPAVGGVILTVSTLTATFFVDVVTALAGVSVLALIPIPVHNKAMKKEKTGYLSDLKEGLRYAAKSKFVKELCVYYAIICIFIVPAAFIAPLLIAREFGDEVWRLTVNEVAYSGGSILGGLILAVWGGFKNRMVTVAVSSMLFGAFTIAMGFAPSFPFFIILMLLVGVIMPFSNTPITVVMQERIDGDMLGRVMSLLAILASAAVPVGMLIFGPIADYVSLSWLFLVSGAFIVFVGAGVFFNKNLRNVGLPSEASPAEGE